MAKRTPGLRKKGEIWHIDKVIAGQQICRSTGETELENAERFLAQITEQLRKVKIYGERLERTFDEAAARFIEEYGHKRSIERDIVTLKAVMPYIGEPPLLKVHSGVIDSYIKDRKNPEYQQARSSETWLLFAGFYRYRPDYGEMNKAGLGLIPYPCCPAYQEKNASHVP